MFHKIILRHFSHSENDKFKISENKRYRVIINCNIMCQNEIAFDCGF